MLNANQDAAQTSSSVGKEIRVPKAAELVAGHLRRQIVRGELREGDALPAEAQLMAQFGVSRPSLREGFRVLESEALISVRRGARGGARVHSPDGDVAARYAGLVLQYRQAKVKDVYEAGAAIEPYCVELITRGRASKDLGTLRSLVSAGDDALAAGDYRRLIDLQDEFHEAVVDLAGNQTLILITSMLRRITSLVNTSYLEATQDGAASKSAARKGQRTHHKLLDLVGAGDAEAATDLWRRHLVALGDHVVAGSVADTVLDVLG